MIIFPAVDIKNEKCVMLKQGKADLCTVFYDDPTNAALMWKEKGSKYLHVVDLDGAFNGRPCNIDKIYEMKKKTGMFVQVGGGIRDRYTIESILDKGIDRVILGSVALSDLKLTEWAAYRFGEKIAVSIDTVDDKVAYNGWTSVSNTNKFDLIKKLTSIGVKTFIYTDVSKDGMMKGPDIKGIEQIKNNFDIHIIASGGVSTMDDITHLKNIGTFGTIIGKALYSGNINLEKALEVV